MRKQESSARSGKTETGFPKRSRASNELKRDSVDPGRRAVPEKAAG
jgi:hypothetical protein